MKKSIKIILIILGIILFIELAIGIYFWWDNHFNKMEPWNSKLRICPDEWYDNQMPGPPSSGPTQYFSLNGERRELSEFDVDWIMENCNLEIRVVV